MNPHPQQLPDILDRSDPPRRSDLMRSRSAQPAGTSPDRSPASCLLCRRKYTRNPRQNASSRPDHFFRRKLRRFLPSLHHDLSALRIERDNHPLPPNCRRNLRDRRSERRRPHNHPMRPLLDQLPRPLRTSAPLRQPGTAPAKPATPPAPVFSPRPIAASRSIT